jgi:hypothetical protein
LCDDVALEQAEPQSGDQIPGALSSSAGKLIASRE